MFFEKSKKVRAAEALIRRMKEERLVSGRLTPEQSRAFSTHIEGAARVARTVALQIPEMRNNPELIDQVYVSALLHDIGRLDEKYERRFHGMLGFEILKNIDAHAARTALIHMFPDNKLPPFENCKSMFFDKREDYDVMAEKLQTITMDEVDKLIQLADALVNKKGLVCLSERFMEYQKRRQISLTEEEIACRYRIKNHFDTIIGQDVYELFPILRKDIPCEKRIARHYSANALSGREMQPGFSALKEQLVPVYN